MAVIRQIHPLWNDRTLEKSILAENKFFDRSSSYKLFVDLFNRNIPDYFTLKSLTKGKSVVDISSGNGVALEIFREQGYEIFGVDYFINESHNYEPFLKSQNIKYLLHDCSKLPLPLADKSFDLLTHIGSIHNFPETIWLDILDEFARIAKRTIFVLVNNGEEMKNNLDKFLTYDLDGFELTLTNNRNEFRWDKQ